MNVLDLLNEKGWVQQVTFLRRIVFILTTAASFVFIISPSVFAQPFVINAVSQTAPKTNSVKGFDDRRVLHASNFDPTLDGDEESPKSQDLDAELDSQNIEEDSADAELDSPHNPARRNVPGNAEPDEESSALDSPEFNSEETYESEANLGEENGRPKRPVFKPTPPPRSQDLGKKLSAKDISVEEVEDYDPNRHWLTGQFALLRNMGTDGSYGYYAGAGARYGYTVFKDIFFFSKSGQDSLALELGVFGVKLANIQNEGDSYTVIPLIFTGRYNIALSENLILFLYGGTVNNIVLNSSNADGDFLSAVQSPPPALGVGLFLLVGPYWYARLDVGLDQIGLGLTLRF